MNLSVMLSLVNVILALISTFGVFHLVGNWHEVVEEEEKNLRSNNFNKSTTCLRVRLSFSKACRKVDEWCGVMGVGAGALLAIAVVFAVFVLMITHITPAISGSSITVSTQVSGSNNSVSGSMSSGQQMAAPNVQSTPPANTTTSPPEDKSSLFLYGVNSVLLVLLIAILASVGQLKVIGSVLQAAREFQW